MLRARPRLIDRLLGDAATVVDEVHGFKYFDERDLLGFVDGTENPDGRGGAAAVTDRRRGPDFAGGSYVIVQKYLHDLDGWNALPVEEQERAIGRTKLDDIELADDVKPANSHVALNTIVDADGERARRSSATTCRSARSARGVRHLLHRLRRAAPAVTEQMLSNMFIGDPPGNHDRILDFSTAVTGSLFFVPTAEFLDDPPTP